VAVLQKFQEFRERKTALLKDIRERAFRNFGVHGNNGLPNLVADSFFQRDMTALLAELYETGPFQGVNHALA
jgi:hypothetical protein